LMKKKNRMKDFKLNLFLFIIWWSIVISSINEIDIHSGLELQTIHQETTFKEIDLNADEHTINMTSDTVNYSQEFFYTEDVQKICHAQVNEFVWKCPTTSGSKEKHLKFRTITGTIFDSATFVWYLKSINEIDIVEMDSKTHMPQIQFYVIDEQTIFLDRLYPTYPEISGFEILQFLANLAFQCKFLIHVLDGSDVSRVYSSLYGKTYYEYHFEGINLSQNFLFKKVIVKEKKFLQCFEENIRDSIEYLSKLFDKNIEICEKTFVSVEFCPITFETQHIFYKQSFQYCIDWSPIGRFPDVNLPFSQLFQINSEDMNRIMDKKKKNLMPIF